MAEPRNDTTLEQRLARVRVEARAVITAIEREALAAGRMLGYEALSRQQLENDIDMELGRLTDRGMTFTALDERRMTAPPDFDKSICVAMIAALLAARAAGIGYCIAEARAMAQWLHALRWRLARLAPRQ